MRAGRLDRRITIQEKVSTLSASGDPVVTWEDLTTVWAEKTEAKGSERFAAQQFIGHAVKTVKVRWSRTLSQLTVSEHRFLFDGRAFDITDLREVGRREGIEIDGYARAEEPLAGGDEHPGSDLLLEDGSFLLQEDGSSTFLLEA